MPLPRILIDGDRAEGVSPLDAGMSELIVLLPQGQIRELEAAAHRRGLTAAQMTRRLIQNFLSQPLHEAD